jgi:hypothetical protein
MGCDLSFFVLCALRDAHNVAPAPNMHKVKNQEWIMACEMGVALWPCVCATAIVPTVRVPLS